MKIYASRSNSDEAQIMKLVGTDVWILVKDYDSVSPTLRFVRFIKSFQYRHDTYVTFTFVNYYLLSYALNGKLNPDRTETLLYMIDGNFKAHVRIEDLEIVQPIQIYTTEELKEIAKGY